MVTLLSYFPISNNFSFLSYSSLPLNKQPQISCSNIWNPFSPSPRSSFLPAGVLNISCRCRPYISSAQLLSHVWHFSTTWTAAHQAFLSIISFRSLLKFMCIKSVMRSDHLFLCCPLLLLPSIFSNIRAFSNESVLCIRWPNWWSINCSFSPSNEYSGLISFKMDWLDLLAVQWTFKSPLQYPS